jgi:hypothetical protein
MRARRGREDEIRAPVRDSVGEGHPGESMAASVVQHRLVREIQDRLRAEPRQRLVQEPEGVGPALDRHPGKLREASGADLLHASDQHTPLDGMAGRLRFGQSRLDDRWIVLAVDHDK